LLPRPQGVIYQGGTAEDGKLAPGSALPADAPEIAVYAGVTATDTIGIHSGGCGTDFPSVVKDHSQDDRATSGPAGWHFTNRNPEKAGNNLLLDE